MRRDENKRETKCVSGQDEWVDVSSVLPNGFWMRVFSRGYFRRKKLGNRPKDYFVSFDRFPWFLGVSEDVIRHVSVSWDHLRWEELDVDLGVDSFEHPERYPYLIFTEEQQQRLTDYNNEQIAKGGTTWINNRPDFMERLKLSKDNTAEEEAEITSITDDGFWMRVFSKDYFREKRLGKQPRDFFVSFDMHPQFLGVSEEEIKQVISNNGELEWHTVDGLIIDELAWPKRHSNWWFSDETLQNLKKYNDTQLVKEGGKPWFNARLLDFPEWLRINERNFWWEDAKKYQIKMNSNFVDVC